MKKSTTAVVLVVCLVALFAVTAAPASANLGKSPGYWANHLNKWWTTTPGVTIGGVVYTNAEACTLMLTPPSGDKTFTMFNAVLAGLLNGTSAGQAYAAGQQWLICHPLGSGVAASDPAWQDSGEGIKDALHATWE